MARGCYEVCTKIGAYVGGQSSPVWMNGKRGESFAWATRFRRLVRDYERLDTTLKGSHYVAFACIMIANMFKQLA